MFVCVWQVKYDNRQQSGQMIVSLHIDAELSATFVAPDANELHLAGEYIKNDP